METKKNIIIFCNNNPIIYNVNFTFDSFNILEFQILKNREIYVPENEIWFLRWQSSLLTKNVEFYFKPNQNLGSSILGLYGNIFSQFGCENNYLDLYFGLPIPIRDNQIKLELINEKGLLIDLENDNLEIFLTIQI